MGVGVTAVEVGRFWCLVLVLRAFDTSRLGLLLQPHSLQVRGPPCLRDADVVWLTPSFHGARICFNIFHLHDYYSLFRPPPQPSSFFFGAEILLFGAEIIHETRAPYTLVAIAHLTIITLGKNIYFHFVLPPPLPSPPTLPLPPPPIEPSTPTLARTSARFLSMRNMIR